MIVLTTPPPPSSCAAIAGAFSGLVAVISTTYGPTLKIDSCAVSAFFWPRKSEVLVIVKPPSPKDVSVTPVILPVDTYGSVPLV